MTNIIEAIERELQRLKDEITYKDFEIENLRNKVKTQEAALEALTDAGKEGE